MRSWPSRAKSPKRHGVVRKREARHREALVAQGRQPLGPGLDARPRHLENRSHGDLDGAPVQGIGACGRNQDRVGPQTRRGAEHRAHVGVIHDALEHHHQPRVLDQGRSPAPAAADASLPALPGARRSRSQIRARSAGPRRSGPAGRRAAPPSRASARSPGPSAARARPPRRAQSPWRPPPCTARSRVRAGASGPHRSARDSPQADRRWHRQSAGWA